MTYSLGRAGIFGGSHSDPKPAFDAATALHRASGERSKTLVAFACYGFWGKDRKARETKLAVTGLS
jgi:hypothetical protein